VVFWPVLPTPLVELLDELFVELVCVASSDEPLDDEPELLDEPDVDEFDDFDVLEVVDCAVASLVTPVINAVVNAPASAAATVPASAARLRREFPFMATTIGPRGSGGHHRNIKPCSSLGRSRIRGRAAPG
jgi:hypothetical protein